MVALCLDFGNTNVKWALFEGRRIIHTGKQKELLVSDLNLIKKQSKFDAVILSSTRHLRKSLLTHLEKNYSFIQLSHETKLPIANQYETPSTLGRDRLAAAIGAWSLQTSDTSLIIDAGTCITYDVLHNNSFIGGNIAPGIYLRIKSMHDYTDKLPLVDSQYGGMLLGRSTKEALQNGALLGTICEISSFIDRVKAMFGPVNVFLTGGDADFFAQHLDSEIFVDPNLVLKGLNEILRYNLGK